MENAEDQRLNGAAAVDRREHASPLGAEVAASDIVASRHGDHLLLQLRGSGATVTIHDYFRKNAAGGYVADEVRFADGRLWQLRPGGAVAAAS